MVPMERKISEDAFVQLLYELDIKGLGILDIRKETVNILQAILAAPEVVVGQFAELGALIDVLEPNLPSCAYKEITAKFNCDTATIILDCSKKKKEKKNTRESWKPHDVNRRLR